MAVTAFLAYAAVVIVGWLVLGTALALVVGKAIHRADCCPHPDLDDDPLAAWPDVWSPAERDRRTAERSWVA